MAEIPQTEECGFHIGDNRIPTLVDHVKYIGCLHQEIYRLDSLIANGISDDLETIRNDINSRITIEGKAQQLELLKIQKDQIYLHNLATDNLNATTEWLSSFIPQKISSQTATLQNDLTSLKSTINGHSSAQSAAIQNRVNVVGQWLYNAIQNINTGNGASLSQVKNAVTEVVGNFNGALANQLLQTKTQLDNAISNSTSTVFREVGAIRNAIYESIALQDIKIKKELESTEKDINNATGLAANDIKQFITSQDEKLLSEVGKIDINLSDDLEDFRGRFENYLNENFANPLIDLINGFQGIGESLDLEGDTFNEKLSNLGKQVQDSVRNQLDRLKQFIENIVGGKYNTWDEFIADWNEISSSDGITNFLMAFLSAPIVLTTLARFWSSPFLEHINHLANERSRAALLTVSDIIRAYHKGDMSQDDLYRELSKQGYSNDRISTLIDSTFNTMPPDILREAFLREAIPTDTHDRFLRDMGFTQSQIEIIKPMYFQIPPITDIIRMMVREVFSPDIAQQFGLFEEYPEKATEFARDKGLNEEWMKNYWGAHWVLPSPQMAFEMLHRNVITDEELSNLLKAQDFMPFWRDKVKAISFSPFTRVDVRRMYKLGVLNEQQVLQAYKDIGYNQEKAQALLEFTKVYSPPEDGENTKDLTRSQIEKAVKVGLLSRDEGLNDLISMGYSTRDANLMLDMSTVQTSISRNDKYLEASENRIISEVLDGFKLRLINRADAENYLSIYGLTDNVIFIMLELAEFEYQNELKKSLLKEARSGYINNTFSRVDFRNTLTSNGFSESEAETQIAELDVIKSVRVRPLSMTQYMNAFFTGLMDLETLVFKLQGLGYPDDNIIYLLAQKGVNLDDA